jgi:hypothetical protein
MATTTCTSNNIAAAPLRSAMASSRKIKKSLPVRRVYFVEERNTLLEFEGINTSDFKLLQQLWQQGWEMDDTKQKMKTRARQWRTTGFGMLLHDAFYCDHGLPPTLCQNQLNVLARLPDELNNRGIERYLSRKHDTERTSRKRAFVQDVVGQYEALREQVDCDILAENELWDILGDYSRSMNVEAEVFARRLGKADEVAMRRGEYADSREAEILMEYLHSRELERISDNAYNNRAGIGPAKKLAPATGSSNLKKVPPAAAQGPHTPHTAATFTSGRRLQARQA